MRRGSVPTLPSARALALFESYCPNISAWLQACPETVKLLPPPSVSWWYQSVGMAAPWAVHSWANWNSPLQRECGGVPRPVDAIGGRAIGGGTSAGGGHGSSGGGNGGAGGGHIAPPSLPPPPPRLGTCDLFNESVYRDWRLKGHSVACRAHVLTAEVAADVTAEWEALNPTGARPVLTMHSAWRHASHALLLPLCICPPPRAASMPCE